MKKQLLTVIICLFACLQSFAVTSYNALWQKGNQFYQQKEYDSATYYYEQIAASQPQNAVVYYNLGNAYYKLNKVGPAVLSYQRALRIAPTYKEAKDNLTLAQSRIANRIPNIPDIFFVSWWNDITNGQHAATWAITTLILFLLLLVLLFVKKTRKNTNIPSQLTAILGIAWIIGVGISFVSAKNKTTSSKAVIMQNDAPLLNSIRGKTQSLVPEGTTVELKDEDSNWQEVRLPDGRTGWMDRSLLTKI